MNSPTTKARILIVEDEIIVARDIHEQLIGLGYEPVADTATGEEAIAMAAELRPGLVLMDVHLAGKMDGIAAAEIIRDRFALPVVFLTAFASEETLKRAKLADPYGYIIKPFEERELRIVIEMALYKHQSEARLRASEEKSRRLATFPEMNPNPVLAFDAAGALTYSNPAALAMARHFNGADLVALLPPETGAIVAECLATEQPRLRLETVQGARTISWSFYPLEAQQTVHCYAGDITERKQAEASIHLQSAALEAATNSVVITNARGRIEWVNPAFCRISGYEKSEVLGENPRILKSGLQPPDYYAAMWRTITGGESWRGEFVNRRKDGRLYTEAVTITPVRSASGQIGHYVAIKQDITALKQSLADLNQAHAELAEKNRALSAALIDAHAAVDAKSSFLATMSHEIRTPLNGVVGMASILRETAPLTPEQRDCVETIRSSGDTLLALIDDILDFSKIESGRLELEHAPLDLRTCIEETLEALAPRAREKQLELAAQIDESVPSAIVGDAVRLRQILTNLAGNAVKFTARGEIVIEVRAEPAEGDRLRVFFRVRDTGIGIAADKLNRLFKSFTQIDTSTTRIYGGTGLGLAISQRLVGIMGGKIEVDSVPGVGSVFYFDLLTSAAPAIEPADLTQFHEGLAGRRALVVDDNTTNRHIFASHLRRANVVPIEAASAVEALDWLLHQAWPDVIITDMLMPGMDGLDFALAVRAREAGAPPPAPVPIIMVSSGGYQSTDPRVAAAGLAVALHKPLRQQHLIAAVAKACALVAPRPAPPEAAIAGHRLTTAARHPRRILLVEDNAVNRKVALRMLGRLGYEADVAVDGLSAVEACRTRAYDLVLMDVQMPVLDGLEATRRVRQFAGQQLSIVAMTANAMSGDREMCLAAGMDDYIAKPINVDELQRIIVAARHSHS